MTNHTSALKAGPIQQRLMLWELAPLVARALCEQRDEATGVQDGALRPPVEWGSELKARRLEYIKRELTIALEQFDSSDLFVAATLLGGPNTPPEFEAWKSYAPDWQTQIARARMERRREYEAKKRKVVKERASSIITRLMANEQKQKATEGIWLALRAAMMAPEATVRATSDAGERRQLDRAEIVEAGIDHVRNRLEIRGSWWGDVEVEWPPTIARPAERPSGDAAAIPTDLITTNEAIAALLASDSAISAWQADGCPRGGGDIAQVDIKPTNEPGNELHIAAEASHARILKAILMAIRDGALMAILYRDGHSTPRTELEPSFWADDFRGSLSLEHGRVRLHSEYEGRPLCFTRREWAAWCKKGKPLAMPFNIEIARAWMQGKMVRRLESGGDRRKPAMVVATRDKFPELAERDARKLFTSMPKALKKKSGPVPGQKSKARARTNVPELTRFQKD